ncbi:hypothetical protein [Oceanisphaera sediminis]
MMDILINILLSILSGIYAGLIVARFVKFEEIRTQVKRVVQDIDFMNEGPNGELVMINEPRIRDLHYCYSELLYLKHKNSADVVGSLITAISSTKIAPGQVTGDIGDFYMVWQSMVRKMVPNIRVLLSPKPRF